MDINIQEDLAILNDQIGKYVEELNNLNQRRDVLSQQIQQLNGAAMYLRGKSDPEGLIEAQISQEEDDLTRSVEYPNEDNTS
jgi:cell division protein FtsB